MSTNQLSGVPPSNMAGNNTPYPVPNRSWFNVGVMSLAHFMSDYYTAFLPVLLPLIATRYDISYSQSASIYMVFMVAMSFAQPPIGIIADKRNLNYLMPLSVITGAVFASAVVLSPNLPALLGIVLLCGLCSSFFHPVSAGIINRVVPLKSKGLGTSFYIAGGNIGAAASPLVVAAFIEQFSEQSLIYMAIPAIMASVLIYMRHLQAPAPQPVKDGKEVKILKLIASKQFIVLNTSIAFRSWSYCAFIVFIPMLYSDHCFSSIEGASVLVVMLVGAVAGGLTGGALTDIFGPKIVTLGSFVLALISGAIFISYADLSFICLAAIFFYGAGAYGSTPNAIVWAQRLMPRNAAFAASMMLGFTFGAGYVESVLTGYFGDIFNLQDALLYTLLITMSIAIVLLMFLKEPPKNDSTDEIKAQVQEEIAQGKDKT